MHEPLIDFPYTPDDLEEAAARERAKIPNYETLRLLNNAMWEAAWASAQAELWEREPWMRKFPELFSR
jgi:hypothetical protein